MHDPVEHPVDALSGTVDATSDRAQGATLQRSPNAAAAFGRRFGWDLAFIGFLAGIGVLRWQVINSFPEPSGLDAGNWLAFGHSLLGSHARSASIVYPPVVPLLMMAFTSIWGPFTGTQVLAVCSSLAPSVGAYVMLRRALGVRAVVLAGLLAPAVTVGEAAAWGGYPQLLGLGLFPLVLWALERFVSSRGMRWAWTASLFLFLTVATSDLIGAVGLVIAPLFLVVRILLIEKAQRPSRRRLGSALLIGAIPLLAVAPVYFGLVGGVFSNGAPRTNRLTVGTLLPNLDNIFKENLGFWHVLLVVAAVSPLVLFVRRGRPLASVAFSILVMTIAGLVLVREDRFFYLLPLAMVVSLGSWWSLLTNSNRPMIWWTLRASSHRTVTVSLDRALLGGMAIVLVVETALGIGAFREQVRWYSVLTPSIVAGLQQLDAVAPSKARIAVSPGPGLAAAQAWPFGWWVEGLLNRPTYYASSLEWLNYQDERQRATLANEIFSPADGLVGAVARARENDIAYIVVATDWPGYSAWAADDTALNSAHIIIDTKSIIVISTSG